MCDRASGVRRARAVRESRRIPLGHFGLGEGQHRRTFVWCRPAPPAFRGAAPPFRVGRRLTVAHRGCAREDRTLLCGAGLSRGREHLYYDFSLGLRQDQRDEIRNERDKIRQTKRATIRRQTR